MPMPFLAACAFCGRESYVPDRARGGSMRCPACSSVYTPVPRVSAPPVVAVPVRPSGPRPFLAMCSFCGRESHVPKSARGGTVWCPNCSNYFRVARRKRRTDVAVAALAGKFSPVQAEPPPALPGNWWASLPDPPLVHPADLEPTEAAAPPPPCPSEPFRLVGDSLETVTAPVVETRKAPRAEPPSLERPTSAGVMPAERAKKRDDRSRRERKEDPEHATRRVDPIGAAALFLGCAALLCAAVSWLCGFVVPLSCVAQCAGITALVRARRSARSRLTFPVAGTGVAGAVLVTALLFPGLLGPTFLSSKDRDVVDPTAIRRFPLPGSSAKAGAEDPEWADASRTGLQQGQLTVQVVDASVSRVEIVSAQNKKGKVQVCLVIRLRIQQLPGANPSAAMQRGDADLLKSEHRPILTDATGKVYVLLDVQTAGAAERRAACRSLD
jgi:DNA-directed RNA polymerase subunit RPC12/RpoP